MQQASKFGAGYIGHYLFHLGQFLAAAFSLFGLVELLVYLDGRGVQTYISRSPTLSKRRRRIQEKIFAKNTRRREKPTKKRR